MLAAAGAAAVTIWLTTAWLLDVADDAPPGTDRVKIRVDAVRTGLAAGGGAGAAVGLMLAFRRQQHQELATALHELDAAERRVTELYNAAAEQLGSDKAPVRLTALYTLERLADDNERHRQTIVNIICAYLRMPFTPPTQPGPEEEHRERGRRNAARYRAARASQPAPAEPAGPTGPDPREELQVRLTAQRLLHTHLQPDADTYWQNISLDLTGAALADFNLFDCRLHAIRLNHATLTGDTAFSRTTFSGGAVFEKAIFSGYADFAGAIFADHTWLEFVSFNGGAAFTGTTFRGAAMFTQTVFSENANFSGAAFPGSALFLGTTFTGRADFEKATFPNLAGFDHARFLDVAAFRSASFHWDALFVNVTFIEPAVFDQATFTKEVKFNSTTFNSYALFREVTFGGIANLGGASFLFPEKTDLEAATVADAGQSHECPADWWIEPTEGGGGRFARVPSPRAPGA